METKTAIEHFRHQPRPLLLRCHVKHYEWGSFDVIPDLLGIDNKARKPYAELWIGAHPDLPSHAIVDKTEVPLNLLIEGAADVILGHETARQFGRRLPFLLKVLSARTPLSVQAHPSKLHAKRGFEGEIRQGKSIDDKTRNYKDDNHKPELIAPLTDFYALCGFRPMSAIASTLKSVPEFGSLVPHFSSTKKSLITLYTHVMRMDQLEVNRILTPLIDRLRTENERTTVNKDDRSYWVLRADEEFSTDNDKDRGIFSVYLLNLVRMVPGQGMYLPAGELHAYLEGTGIEIMANSDNVLRGGLTSKHVDVEELLKTLTFTSGRAKVITATSESYANVETYAAPVNEFRLSRLRVTASQPYTSVHAHSVRVGIVTKGHVSLTSPTQEAIEVACGGSFLVSQRIDYSLSSGPEAVIFQAEVPVNTRNQ